MTHPRQYGPRCTLTVNTSEGCFEIGVTISNPVFTEDAINKRKQERELLNKICIVSMLARLRLMPKGCAQ
ncbi:cell division inhibition protein DicB [Escherichia coli]|uniref:cell division inhibition protein DicB n=1 Tax=Escherichia coli TaxID=562 RepID=UPI002B27BCA3|nr:cell division inhibition protein DicB [Escherichia coli]MEA8795002.1 cell division inhibition protein DicB [Escherichia coli]